LTYYFQPHYVLLVDSASIRNQYQHKEEQEEEKQEKEQLPAAT
jgi:hypothetical protein